MFPCFLLHIVHYLFCNKFGIMNTMGVKTSRFTISTEGMCDVHDITPHVERSLRSCGLRAGIVCVFVPGSTAGITSIEYEPGAVTDLKKTVERLAPRDIPYAHDARWGDGNGFSHVRASLLGASFSVPFSEARLLLGTWQQVVLVDFDNRPRKREVVVQIYGE